MPIIRIRRQTSRRYHDPAVVERQAAGMGRHSPGHVCRRPRQQHSHRNWSCNQPCRHQQDQQIQSTLRPLEQQVSGTTRQLSWSRNLEGGRPLSSHETPERPPTCSSSYQWLCKRGTRSRFRTCSQPASLLQRVIYFFLTSIFSAYGFVLAGHK